MHFVKNIFSKNSILFPIIFLFCCFHLSNFISIDNDIIGEPDIECLDQEIRVWVKTRKYFQGRIYAKGKSDDQECAKDDFALKRTKKVNFDLGLGRCGMRSLRSFDPRGMYYGITLVISFHPIFITKVDQAFHVKCFFEEASKGLTAELGVSMLPTTEVEARHGIPGCSYSIHRSSIDELDAGKPAGAVIQFARVGDKVLHQWYCSTNEMFGILINNCFVTDGVKQRVQVIDAQGCPLDPILITGTRYSADLQRAYAESQVFKFADRPGIWFFCQIQMCMKKDGMCDGITPPNCPGVSIKSGKVLPYKRNEGDKPVKKGGIYADEEEHDEVKKNKNDSQNEVLNEQTRLFEQNKSNATNGPTLSGSDYEPLEVIQPPATNIDEEDDESSRPEFTTTSLKVPIAKRPTTAKENESINYVSSPSYANIAEAPSIEPEIQVFSPGYSSNNYQIGNDPPVALSKTITIDNNNPYLPPQPVLRSNGNNNKQHEVVNTEYETEANIPRRKQQTKNDKEITSSSILLPTLNTIAHKTVTSQRESPTISTRKINNKKDEVEDYSDSDELNIPPSLHNLLANLQPDQINAQSLQKMFKDSVADRRALLQSVDFIIRKMNKEAEEEKGVEEETRRDRREKDLDNDEEQVEFIEDRTEENWKEEDERRNEQMAELLMKMEVYKKLKGKGIKINRMILKQFLDNYLFLI
ncbi:ZP domain-containing protein [Meloidogyne graminicola]|uniref:ZP domain-containing protein n=1 Tax=Meloidogyne graminicola TaxID=189291 RepID=A0A8S9ZGC7_9BILA|nr:ZP domain-containing protein [Meloidogyne graminicola]